FISRPPFSSPPRWPGRGTSRRSPVFPLPLEGRSPCLSAHGPTVSASVAGPRPTLVPLALSSRFRGTADGLRPVRESPHRLPRAGGGPGQIRAAFPIAGWPGTLTCWTLHSQALKRTAVDPDDASGAPLRLRRHVRRSARPIALGAIPKA